MAKEIQNLKLLYLVDIFEKKTNETHGLSAKELMEELNEYGIHVERKTLYRDIALLQKYGLDIIKDRNGRSIVYYLGNREFELPELKLMVDAIQSSRFITKKNSKTLIGKIESLTNEYDAEELNRQVYVSGRVKTENESIYYIVDSIHSAINKDRKISFQYYELFGNRIKRLRHNGDYYSVSPWIMLWNNQNYYLVAYDDKNSDIRHYRLDRMTNVNIKDEKRSGKRALKDLDVGAFTRKTFGMFSGEEKRVTIAADNSHAGILFDRFGNDTKTRAIDDDHVEIEVDVNVSDQFLGWIVSLGNEIKITGPEDVVEKMRKMLDERVRVYTKK